MPLRRPSHALCCRLQRLQDLRGQGALRVLLGPPPAQAHPWTAAWTTLPRAHHPQQNDNTLPARRRLPPIFERRRTQSSALALSPCGAEAAQHGGRGSHPALRTPMNELPHTPPCLTNPPAPPPPPYPLYPCSTGPSLAPFLPPHKTSIPPPLFDSNDSSRLSPLPFYTVPLKYFDHPHPPQEVGSPLISAVPAPCAQRTALWPFGHPSLVCPFLGTSSVCPSAAAIPSFVIERHRSTELRSADSLSTSSDVNNKLSDNRPDRKADAQTTSVTRSLPLTRWPATAVSITGRPAILLLSEEVFHRFQLRFAGNKASSRKQCVRVIKRASRSGKKRKCWKRTASQKGAWRGVAVQRLRNIWLAICAAVRPRTAMSQHWGREGAQKAGATKSVPALCARCLLPGRLACTASFPVPQANAAKAGLTVYQQRRLLSAAATVGHAAAAAVGGQGGAALAGHCSGQQQLGSR